MALVETGIMTDIKLGSTDVQLVLQGGNVIWERDRYPQVTWPEDYYMPYKIRYGVGSLKVYFFIPSDNPISVHFVASADDCEGEGGGPREYYLLDENGVLEHNDLRRAYNITADTGNKWILMTDSWELELIDPGNIYSDYNSKGMLVSGGDEAHGDMCPTYYDISSAFTSHYQDIEFFGILGDDGNTGNDAPFWAGPQGTGAYNTISQFTSLKWFFTQDTHWNIPLYVSSAWTADTMKFSVKNSRGATFIVIDNAYWRSIIPWDMADYYNVTFRDKDTNNIITRY